MDVLKLYRPDLATWDCKDYFAFQNSVSPQ